MRRKVTREDIIDLTQRMIVSDGIGNVRIDDIAHKLEMSKRTLYELIGDKDTLILLSWDRIIKSQEGVVNEILQKKSDKAIEQACQLMEAYISHICLVSGMSLRELNRKVSYNQIMERVKNLWFTSFYKVFDKCKTHGEILSGVDSKLFADRLMHIVYGLYMDGSSCEEMQKLAQALLRGIASPSTIEWIDTATVS